jgi:hypothetical protein
MIAAAVKGIRTICLPLDQILLKWDRIIQTIIKIIIITFVP